MESEIRKLYIDLCDASINKDVAKLNEILSEDYTLTHMTGLRQSKSDYINSVTNGELKYYEVINDDIEVTINGDIAYIIGKSRTLASPFGMNKSWWKLKQDLTLKNVDGRWVITSSIASTY